MTQAELNRAVARATGETVTTIRDLGFSLADSEEAVHDPDSHDLDAQVVDWDELDTRRSAVFPQQHTQEPALA